MTINALYPLGLCGLTILFLLWLILRRDRQAYFYERLLKKAFAEETGFAKSILEEKAKELDRLCRWVVEIQQEIGEGSFSDLLLKVQVRLSMAKDDFWKTAWLIHRLTGLAVPKSYKDCLPPTPDQRAAANLARGLLMAVSR